ncbi:MAG: DUF4157 domain-containing protein [Anaerolineae bacterium]|nr:DUF4157 domain-containing protein [Anaerolineae bacterium]
MGNQTQAAQDKQKKQVKPQAPAAPEVQGGEVASLPPGMSMEEAALGPQLAKLPTAQAQAMVQQMNLQLGNRYVQKTLASLHKPQSEVHPSSNVSSGPALQVSQPGDAYEQEAEQVADVVTHNVAAAPVAPPNGAPLGGPGTPELAGSGDLQGREAPPAAPLTPAEPATASAPEAAAPAEQAAAASSEAAMPAEAAASAPEAAAPVETAAGPTPKAAAPAETAAGPAPKAATPAEEAAPTPEPAALAEETAPVPEAAAPAEPGASPVPEAAAPAEAAEPSGIEAASANLDQTRAKVEAEPSPFDLEAPQPDAAMTDIGASAPQAALAEAQQAAPAVAAESVSAAPEAMMAEPLLEAAPAAPQAAAAPPPAVPEAPQAAAPAAPQAAPQQAAAPAKVQPVANPMTAAPEQSTAPAAAPAVAPAKSAPEPQKPNRCADASCRAEAVQLKALGVQRDASAGIDASGAVTPEVGAEIQTMQQGGEPLPPSTRATLEPRFGADFSQVRVHRDEKAAKTSEAVGAQAFTVGNHIAFGEGKYAPETSAGQQLLAHELTHTIQQTGGQPQAQRAVPAQSTGGPVVQRGLLDSVANAAQALLSKLIERLRPAADQKAQSVETHAQGAAQGVSQEATTGAGNVATQSAAESQGVSQAAQSEAANVQTQEASSATEMATQAATETTGVQTEATSATSQAATESATQTAAVESQAQSSAGEMEAQATTQTAAIEGQWGQVQSQATGGVSQVESQAQGQLAGVQTQADAAVTQADSGMSNLQGQATAAIPTMEASAVEKLRGLRDQAIATAEGIQSPKEVAGSGLGALLAQAQALLGDLDSIIGPIWELLKNAWLNLQKLLKGLWDMAKGLFTKALDALKALGAMLWNKIKQAWDALKQLARNAWNTLKNLGRALLARLQAFAREMLNKMRALVQGLMARLRTFIQTVRARLSALANQLVNKLRTLATTAWNKLKTTASNAWQRLKGFGQSLWSRLTGKAKGAESGIAGEKSGGESSLKGMAGDLLGKVMSFISSFVQRAGGALSNLQGQDAGAQAQYQSAQQAAEAQHQTQSQAAQAQMQQSNAAAQAQMEQAAATEQAQHQTSAQAAQTQANTGMQAAQAAQAQSSAAAETGLAQAQAAQTAQMESAQAAREQQSGGIFDMFRGALEMGANLLRQGWEGLRGMATQAGQRLSGGWAAIQQMFQAAKERIRQSWIGVVARAAALWARASTANPEDSEAWDGITGSAKDLKGSALQLKARSGGPGAEQDPNAIMQQLGEGQSFGGAARSRMEGAFGGSFGDVRVHTDSNAAQVARSVNARALTVGNHIAFDAGEYQPGSMVGDALLAHELAHTVQQRGAGAETAAKGYAPEESAEEMDADKAAVGAVVARSMGMKGMMRNLPAQVMPQLRTGLRLRRCPKPKVNFDNIPDVQLLQPTTIGATVEDLENDENLAVRVKGESAENGNVGVVPSTLSGEGSKSLDVSGVTPTTLDGGRNLSLVGEFDNEEVETESNKFAVQPPQITFGAIQSIVAGQPQSAIWADTDTPISVNVDKWTNEMPPIVLSIEGSDAPANGSASIGGGNTYTIAGVNSDIQLRGLTPTACGAEGNLHVVAKMGDAIIARSAGFSVQGVNWLGDFTITHYTFALEDDPIYANDQLVDAPGLNEQHRYGFLYGASGILMQGTGQASNGQYITIDWNAGGPQGENTTFTYGIGGAGGNPEPWRTVASDPGVVPTGTEVVIENYRDRGTFLANDTGDAITGNHLDVFVGGVTLAEANQLGTITSRVGIPQPICAEE